MAGTSPAMTKHKMRNASQFARAPGAVRGKRFFRMRIELPGARVTLDRGVELPGVERLEPGAKPRKLARGKLFNGSLDVFGGSHIGNLTSAREP